MSEKRFYRSDINQTKEIEVLIQELQEVRIELETRNEELRKCQNELQKMKLVLSELERSNKDLEQFAYVASHDLQEPLRMVKNYTELLSRKYSGRLDQSADVYINFIVDGAARMQNLIKDLLRYARISTRAHPFEVIKVECIINEILEDLNFLISDTNAKVSFNHLPKIFADPTQIRQVFQNLIINAIKFRGEKLPEIEIGAIKLEQFWQFSISDNGIGISQEYRDKVFHIFHRAHESSRYPGNGIGLAICKKIIERHGGCIWVDSDHGNGATFYFTIPHSAVN